MVFAAGLRGRGKEGGRDSVARSERICVCIEVCITGKIEKHIQLVNLHDKQILT